MPTSRREHFGPAIGPLTALTLWAAFPLSASAAEEGERSGHLIALSDPPGAYVFVDGVLLGRTPVRSVALTPGDYRIWFRTKPPLTFEPAPLPERTFEIVESDSVLIHETMGSLVRIETDPPNATVTIDGRSSGRTPIDVRWLPARNDELRVSLEGHLSRAIAPERLAGGGAIRVQLTPLEPVDPIGADRMRGGLPSRVNWKAFGALAVGGAAAGLALHFKSRADEAYERYLASAVAADMEHHLDDANHFDRLSSVSWIAAEGGFLAAIWFFAKRVLEMDRVPRPIIWSAGGRTSLGVELRH